MINQTCVTVAAIILPGVIDSLTQALAKIGSEVENDGGVFGRINQHQPHIHFGRWIVLEEKQATDGSTLRPQLIYLCDSDLSAPDHLSLLVKHRLSSTEGETPDVLDAIYSYCEGYPENCTEQNRLEFLQNHLIAVQTFYVNTIGRTVEQIWKEEVLRDTLDQYLDSKNWDGQTALQIRTSTQAFVKDQINLAWALNSPPTTLLGGALNRVKDVLRKGFGLVIDGLNVFGKSPLAYVFAGSGNESTDRVYKADIAPVAPPLIEELEERDTYQAVQSPFAAIGLVKPGVGNNEFERLKLLAANVGAHNLYGDSDLAGVKTIHFARWIFMDDGRRVLFCSNYDGSLENYMSDFIDLVAWGLNLVFGEGIGYPKTVLGLFAGAEHELDFRTFLRNRQVPAPNFAWYSAYPQLTALNLRTNSEIREGLIDQETLLGWIGLNPPMKESDAQNWLSKFTG